MKFTLTGVIVVFACLGCRPVTSAAHLADAALRSPIKDAESQEVFMPLQPVMTFARAEPRLSAHGRDFVHIIPIQTSLNGHRVTYLWFGTSSTIDRGVSHGEPTASFGISASPASARLDAVSETDRDGVRLPLVPWQSGRLLAKHVAMPFQTSQRTGIHRRDLRRLVDENPTSVTLFDTAGNEKRYEHVLGAWR